MTEGIIIGVFIGVVGTLFVQASSERAMDGWYNFVATAREWAITVCVVLALAFVVCVIAYANGWRP